MPLNPGDPGYQGPLNGKEEICKYMRIHKEQLIDAIRAGAPIRRFGRRFRSHTNLVDEWWRYYLTKTTPISPSDPLTED